MGSGHIEWKSSPTVPPAGDDDENGGRRRKSNIFRISRYLVAKPIALSSDEEDDDVIELDDDGKKLEKFQDEPCDEIDETNPHRLERIAERWKKEPKPEPQPSPEQAASTSGEDLIKEVNRLGELTVQYSSEKSRRRSEPPTLPICLPEKREEEPKLTPITPRTYFQKRFEMNEGSQRSADKNRTPDGPRKRVATSTPINTSSKRFCGELESLEQSPIPSGSTTPLASFESPKSSRRPTYKLNKSGTKSARASLFGAKPIVAAISKPLVELKKAEPKKEVASHIEPKKEVPKQVEPKKDDSFEWDDDGFVWDD